MRQIKFRAWDGKKTHEDVVVIDGEAYKREYIGNILNPDARAGMPMQFTGLKDENEKEIYEGDVVKITVDVSYETSTIPGIIHETRVFIEKVFWDDATLGWAPFLLPIEYSVEVIGNIYENPELLK